MRIIIIGAGGRLGAALAREYATTFDVRAYTHADVDLTDLDRTRELLRPLDFDLLINSAALTHVDYCEDHRDEAFMINAEAPQVLAELCQEKNAKLIQISTDYVFDGEKDGFYTQRDQPSPQSVYAVSKLAGERRAQIAWARTIIVRSGYIFGHGGKNFLSSILERARRGDHLRAIKEATGGEYADYINRLIHKL